ncbi:uncharacterized protein LOC125029226 isoform X3 [Penaeus chinensis]|uniref:uncharacterized protein LOC125029226 isoform X3 n=1 Tax=Penaeus chinensis TaxID=139456 RepID=UPI001FB64EE2|nr:uncharacterized protein LOC125029226 isoform X3 [Penaeus chinensis]
MDTSTTSEEELETSHETSAESIGNEVTELRDVTLPHRPSPFTLRSQCGNGRCPMGTGLYFRSRISPSPGKGRVRSRRRRRSDQSRMDTTDGTNTTLDTSLDTTQEHHYHHHHHHHHGHHHHHAHDHEHHQHGHEHHNHRPHHHHRHHHEEETQEKARASRRKTKETTVTSSESRETTTFRTTTDSRSQAATQVDANGGIGGIAETVRKGVLGFFTPTKNTSLPAIVESSESGFEEGSVTGETVVVSSPNSERFVSAREFFAEADTRERLTSDYFSGSDTPSKLRESTRRLSLCKPLNPYIAYSSDEEFDDWKQQPKSDYTYSTSLTYRDRVTPDRKIGSPNMSRRSLRGGNVGYLNSPDFSTVGLDSEQTTSRLNLRNRAVLRSMDALSDTSDAEDTQEQLIIPRRRSSRSRSIDVMPKSNGTAMSRTITSSTYTTTRTLHRGLDADSDVDDGSESTVPIRATPLTARGGTPLGRSSTPLTGLRNRSSLATENTRGGYTLAKGAIAEDIEEEDEKPKNTIVAWSQKSWETVVRMTMIMTTSVIAMATRAVTATTSNKVDEDSQSEKDSQSSFISRINTTRRRMVTTTTEYWESTKERLRKNPILIWIPLLLLLLVLALVAYWWLLQSRAKTGDATDPKETDGTSFLTLLVTSVSDMTHSSISGISWGLGLAWLSLVDLYEWIGSAFVAGVSAAWVSVSGMFTWLGSVTYACLAYALDWLYIVLGFLQYIGLAILSFFTSGVSYLSALFLPVNDTNNNMDEAQTTTEDVKSWSIVGWVSSIVPKESFSQLYASATEITQTSGNWLWNSWLWLIVTLGEALTSAATYAQWLLYSLFSLVVYLLTGLWNLLVYLFLGLIGLITSAASSVSYAAVTTSSAVTSGAKLIVLPFYGSSESTKETTSKTVITTPKVEQNVNVNNPSVVEIVDRVLGSEELKTLIAAVASETSTKGQLTLDDVSNLVKSVVEGELTTFKEEASALRDEVGSKISITEDTNNYILSMQAHQEHLIKQLDELGTRLIKMEGSNEESQKLSAEQRQEYEDQLTGLKKEIDLLGTHLNKLHTDHTNLATEVKSCCKNSSLTLADVERHVTTLLGDILGLPASSQDEGAEDGVNTWSAGEMGAWLKSYFVAKDELETRLNLLTASMQMKPVEGETDTDKASGVLIQQTIAQTTQMVMDTVLEKLRAEIHKQHSEFSDQAQQQVTEQVNLQMQAAAEVLGTQITDQLQHRFETTKVQITDQVNIAVDSAVKDSVSKSVASVVPEVVAKAAPDMVAAVVPGIVAQAVPGAVDSAVKIAVAEAVPEAVEMKVSIAVPSAVRDAVAETVPEAVAKAVPEAVSEALPDAVNEAVNAAVPEAVSAAVPEAVASAAPEVVASLLPSVVQAAVNETVSSVVPAAVEMIVNKAGDQDLKQSGGDNIAIMGVSSATDSSEEGKLSATVNISQNLNNGSNFSFVPSGSAFSAGLNESAVIQIVKDALMKYDADKTGMVDHALETAGGNIISTRCTESYQVHQAEVSILGFPVYRYSTNTPRTIIQPGRMPGQCWAFKGSQGYIVIQLAGSVRPTGFSLEHIPKSLSPTGEIDSAPREFEVWGLHKESDEGVHLGSYEYNQNGDPLQYFPVTEENAQYFPMIEVKINSNHGNLQYTCIYRFRVHGLRYV